MSLSQQLKQKWLFVLLYFFSAGHSTLKRNTCEVPYTEVVVANVLISVISFWIPILIIFVLYGLIYRKCSELRRRNREKKIFLSTYLMRNMNLAYGLESANPRATTSTNRSRSANNTGQKDTLKDPRADNLSSPNSIDPKLSEHLNVPSDSSSASGVRSARASNGSLQVPQIHITAPSE